MMRSSISYIYLFYLCVVMVVMVVTARFQNSPNRRATDRLGGQAHMRILGRKTRLWHHTIKANSRFHQFIFQLVTKRINYQDILKRFLKQINFIYFFIRFLKYINFTIYCEWETWAVLLAAASLSRWRYLLTPCCHPCPASPHPMLPPVAPDIHGVIVLINTKCKKETSLFSRAIAGGRSGPPPPLMAPQAEIFGV